MSKKLFISLAAVVVVIITAVFIAFSFDRGTKTPDTQLPVSILKTVNSELPGGEIISIVTENEEDGIIYKIVKMIDGVKYEIKVGADGVVKIDNDDIEEEVEEEIENGNGNDDEIENIGGKIKTEDDGGKIERIAGKK
jgi:hypothetical protein